MNLRENTLFDSRYKLLRKLGEGGYSEVWCVEDTIAKFKLALKIFLPSAQLDERGIELFRNEFTVIYNLNHSNLLKCTYLGVSEGCPYLVMPFYEGGSAEDLIGKCDEQTCWAFIRDVAAGLAHLHGQHPPIIHQDIKPDNILIDKGKYVITDFGISFNMRNALAGEVEEEVVKGTKPYMPPEKFLPDSVPLMAGDIWALGASAFELLTGRLPFKSGGLDQHEDTPIPELPDTFSDDLRALVTQCLDFHPWERPFAKDVERLAALKLKKKDQEPPPPVEGKKTGRKLIFILIAAAVAGVAFMIFKTLPDNNTRELTAPPKVDTTEQVIQEDNTSLMEAKPKKTVPAKSVTSKKDLKTEKTQSPQPPTKKDGDGNNNNNKDNDNEPMGGDFN